MLIVMKNYKNAPFTVAAPEVELPQNLNQKVIVPKIDHDNMNNF